MTSKIGVLLRNLDRDEVRLMMNCGTERLALFIQCRHAIKIFSFNEIATSVFEKKKRKKSQKSQKANFFNFPARELVLVSKAPSWAPDFRSVLRKILTGLEHSQNPVFTQIKLGYSRNMYFVVITFSSALRDSTPEHKSLARSCWDQTWFWKKILTSGTWSKSTRWRRQS